MSTSERPQSSAARRALVLVSALGAFVIIALWAETVLSAHGPLVPTPPELGSPGALERDLRPQRGPGAGESHVRMELAPTAPADGLVTAIDADLDGMVEVTSAEALPLVGLEWSSEDEGSWNAVDAPRVPRRARSVRALGHSQSIVAPHATSVVLVADALLRVHVGGLSEGELTRSVRAVDVELWPELDEARPERAALTTLAAQSSLAVAIVPSRTSPQHLQFELSATLALASGASLVVQWTPRAGARDELAVELEPSWVQQQDSPLLLRETGAPEAIGGRRIVSARIVPPPSATSPWIVRSWRNGEAGAYLQRDGRIWREESFEDPSALSVPKGLEYLVTLQRDDGWYARRRVQHDGTEHVLALSPPARLRARLVDAEGRAIAGGRAAVDFAAVPDAPHGAVHWNTNAGTSDSSGELTLTLPGPLKLIDSARFEAAELPRRCRVTFEAAGHTRHVLDVDLDPGVTHDLGDVVLASRPPDLIVELEEDGYELVEVAWEAEGSIRRAAVRSTKALPDGALQLELSSGDASPDTERVMLFTNGGDALSARRRDGRYVPDPTRALRCALDLSSLDPPPSFLQVLARMGTMTWQVAGCFGEDVLTAVHALDALVPAEGVTLEWRWREAGQALGPPQVLPWPAPGSTLRLTR